MSLARICREGGDEKLSLAKEIEEELELLCDAVAIDGTWIGQPSSEP